MIKLKPKLCTCKYKPLIFLFTVTKSKLYVSIAGITVKQKNKNKKNVMGEVRKNHKANSQYYVGALRGNTFSFQNTKKG